MSELDIVIRIVIAIGLGFLVGIERDRNLDSSTLKVDEKGNLGGIRTYTTISLLGGLAGLIFRGDLAIISYLIFSFIIILISLSYILHFLKSKSLGITTEVATIITFLLGFLATVDIISLKFTLAFGVVLAFLLAQKTGIHEWVSKVKRREVLDVIKYFVIVLAIYPFLPNKIYLLSDFPQFFDFLYSAGFDVASYSDIELINPSSLWFIVVFLTGINLLGYFLAKIFDEQKATFLTSFFAGFISSTGLINAHSIKSNQTKNTKDHVRLAAGGIIAHGSSFLTILFISFVINYSFFTKLIFPLGFMALLAIGIGVIMLINTKNHTEHHPNQIDAPIFTLKPALFLAVMIAFVKVISQFGLIFAGNVGFYISILVASMVGMDAASVTTADLAGEEVNFDFALLTIFGAIAVNSVIKVLTSYFAGQRAFTRSIAFGLGLSFIGGLVVLIQSLY